MGQDDEKYILKKLMQDALAEEEQAALERSEDREATNVQPMGECT